MSQPEGRHCRRAAVRPVVLQDADKRSAYASEELLQGHGDDAARLLAVDIDKLMAVVFDGE